MFTEDVHEYRHTTTLTAALMPPVLSPRVRYTASSDVLVTQSSLNFCLYKPVKHSGFGGLEVACWPLVPKFAGSNPAEAVGFFQGEKILSTPSFGGEVKPSVPCRRFTACKRLLNATWKSGISGKIHRPFLAHIVPHLATRILGDD